MSEISIPEIRKISELVNIFSAKFTDELIDHVFFLKDGSFNDFSIQERKKRIASFIDSNQMMQLLCISSSNLNFLQELINMSIPALKNFFNATILWSLLGKEDHYDEKRKKFITRMTSTKYGI